MVVVVVVVVVMIVELESALSSHHVGSRDPTQAITVGAECYCFCRAFSPARFTHFEGSSARFRPQDPNSGWQISDIL